MKWSVALLQIALILPQMTLAAEKAKPVEARAAAERETFREDFTGIEFVKVLGGTFQMGDVFDDGHRDEKPVRPVTVSDFFISKTEVTQGQWQAVMGSNPSNFRGATRPVEHVSWADCQEFLRKLNEKTGKKFRLPTEAEWEYAARSGGKREKWAGTSNEREVRAYAWYDEDSQGETHPVAQKKPNGLGLFDMSGNVWEWCQDWYGDYAPGAETNPTGPATGAERVYRGGSWTYPTKIVRTTYRSMCDPTYRYGAIGLRIAFSVP